MCRGREGAACWEKESTPHHQELGEPRAAVHERGRKGSHSFFFFSLLPGSSVPPLLAPGGKHPLRCHSKQAVGLLAYLFCMIRFLLRGVLS